MDREAKGVRPGGDPISGSEEGAPARGGEGGRVPFVYLVRCADDSLYCGWTTDVERRLAAHQAGTASRYTRSRRPVELAAVMPVADRSAALREEARIKRLPRAAKLALVPARGR
jgi:putative endonuclease